MTFTRRLLRQDIQAIRRAVRVERAASGRRLPLGEKRVFLQRIAAKYGVSPHTSAAIIYKQGDLP